MRRALTETFPNVKVVVDAPVQMEREVAALRQATGVASGRDFEAMLGALAQAVPPKRVATGVDYANGELRVRGLALAGADMAGVASTLHTYGYNVNASGDALVVSPGAQQ